MHQSKKATSGILACRRTLGLMANQGLSIPVIGTAAHIHDITQAQALLYGDETDVFRDAGYQGVEKQEENLALPVT